MAKNIVLSPILFRSRAAKIIFKKSGSVSHWILWSAIIMYNIRKKLMIQFGENLVTDGLTDESDFRGRCPTNVKRPKTVAISFKNNVRIKQQTLL